ncbi:polysaccharide biosynthesis protein [Celeribacter persicus]|uniref:FlaA1/EpsC-like NDP-sugar epimerase n=1 Tax=Celeribacter persicus TaxID=1651082 RepID=A0A2T5HTL2_9RHOB|nr:nucleoside-diphosphate sugar epimerase/dehydratase [Celeribacter persicus]PTQ74876.1 FlaA1/EpsC-like NDP-sugar epimerase [Celeribacter persicus]
MYKKVLIVGLTSLPRKVIRGLLLTSDLAVLMLSLILSLQLLPGMEAFRETANALWLSGAIVIGGLTLNAAFRLDRIKLVMLNARDLLNIARFSFGIALTFWGAGTVLGMERIGAPGLVFGIFAFAGLVASRAIAVSILGGLRGHLHKRKSVAIFGAGAAGVQLASALGQSPDRRVVAFFDDNPTLQSMEIGGIPVLPSGNLVPEIFRNSISELIIALPDSAKKRRDAIVDLCASANVEVRILPSFIDMLIERGNARLRTVDPDEVLGRGKVDLDTPEVARSYAGRVIMVTGAGGSIGSELCRQLLHCQPAKIVLFEQNEYNLYRLDFELRARAKVCKVEVVPCLGTVTDAIRLSQMMRQHQVEIVLHAAAYKHVPLLENNEIEGVRNNVMGTKILADTAVQEGVARFILVSSDKAVRPTSIMGATKRISELIVQDIQTRAPNTKFSMVRFGNVLGSSGSVLPLFQAQIESGGPVTVTHPEIRRYFMTVSEASRLVLLAGAYAEGGDVFVLDMGKPQKIMDLARKLIHLSGRRVKDPVTGEGDIGIEITGLRPGEKLFEELFVSPETLCQTPHPKILRAEEHRLSEIEVAKLLREIHVAIETSNRENLRPLVMACADGWGLTGRFPPENKSASDAAMQFG